MVTVAEIGRPCEPESDRHPLTALGPTESGEALVKRIGGIGREVDASGP